MQWHVNILYFHCVFYEIPHHDYHYNKIIIVMLCFFAENLFFFFIEFPTQQEKLR